VPEDDGPGLRELKKLQTWRAIHTTISGQPLIRKPGISGIWARASHAASRYEPLRTMTYRLKYLLRDPVVIDQCWGLGVDGGGQHADNGAAGKYQPPQPRAQARPFRTARVAKAIVSGSHRRP
jgi:hypothetical protein